MVSLQSCSILNSLSSSSSSKITITNAVSSGPKYLRNSRFTVTKKSNQTQKHLFIDEFHNLTNFPLKETQQMNLRHEVESKNDVTLMKLYAVLEAVNDRIEMHQNVCEQRENWNSLLLNSINMITLTAVTMSGLAEAASGSVGPLKVSASVLFAAGTGLLLIMNRVQPCQLVEEQRNAVRLLKQVQNTIQTVISTRKPTQTDVEEAMEKVLALDRAYPLPLIGAMLEKFPERLEPAVWWPCQKQQSYASLHYCSSDSDSSNGWSQELEDEMREIIGVTKRKDVEDYVKLGNKALKLNKILAVSGPILTGVAAVGAACGGHGSWGGVVAAAAGSMAAAVNTLEHGGQVGMVFEMYRNCAGFFRLLEETVESTLDEGDLRKRENGEVFEMKMALHLGRSLSELRNLADKSSRNGGHVDEFASKLF